MKHGLYFFLFFSFVGISKTQAQENLIPNNSFESYSDCPEYLAQLSFVLDWFTPNNNSPDYFNSCAPVYPLDNSVYVPNNCLGNQYARSGFAYAGEALIYNNLNGRDYIACPLTGELANSKEYYISFYASLAESSNAAVGSIGAYFFVDSFFLYDQDFIDVVPQFQHAVDSIILDKTNWTHISGNFTAKGGEKYMIIGNFLDDAHTKVDTLIPDQIGYQAYYYIDDVTLYEVKDTQSNHPFLQHENAFGNIGKPIELLVIPTLLSANSDVNWQFINLQENTTVKLYNAIGQLVFSVANYQNNLAVSLLAAGIYFYAVQLEDGEMLMGKLVVIR